MTDTDVTFLSCYNIVGHTRMHVISFTSPPFFVVLLLFLQKQNLANAIYLFGLGTLLSGLGLKHMRIRSHHDLAGTLVTPYSWEDHGGVLRLLPVYPSQCSLLQVTSTDVAFPPFCRSCPCDRHDLYLPSIPASLQTLGRCECAAACALAPLGVRIT